MVPTPSQPLSSSSTRRTAKRVDWVPESAITVDLLRPGRDSLPVCWADLSLSGVMLIVPIDCGFDVRTGGRLELGFTADGIRFHMHGTVAWAELDETGKIYKAGVEFDPIEEDLGELHPELWQHFNRRESFRAGCAADETVDVVTRGPHGQCTGCLLDISTSGAGLIFDEETASHFHLDEGLDASFQLEVKLADDLPTVLLEGLAKRFERVGRYAVLAVSFPHEFCERAEDELRVIAEYVARRERSQRDEG